MTAADESRVVWRHEANTSGDASPAQSGPAGATVFVPPVGLAAGVAARSEPRAEGLREALSYARLVSQWHGAIGSGPIEVLDGELAELGRLANRELAALRAATPPAEDRPERLAYMKGWDDAMNVRLNQPEPDRKDEDSQYAINAALGTPPAEGLDVERLAIALHNEWDVRVGEPSEPGVICGDCRESAERIVAEYAALAPEQPE